MNVIPLENVIPDRRIRKGTYFISKDGSVWSTISQPRTSPITDLTGKSYFAAKMDGGYDGTGCPVYSFNIGAVGCGYRTTVKKATILSYLKSVNWPKSTSETPVIVGPKSALVMPVEKQVAKYWIVGKISNDKSGWIAGETTRYTTQTSANNEAERLAKQYPGARFQVFESLGSVIGIAEVRWN